LEMDAKDALSFLQRKSPFVFADENGDRYHRDSFLNPLQRAAERAGIQKRIDVHCLRHSFGSNKIRQGWGLKKVSILLGHAEITITSKIYAHLLDGDLKVRDDFRFDFDKTKISIDSDKAGGIDEKLSQILAKAIANSALDIPGGEALLSALLSGLSSGGSVSHKLAPARSSEILPDSTVSKKNGQFAPPVLHSTKTDPLEKQKAPFGAFHLPNAFDDLTLIFNGGSEGTRTLDLRRDRAPNSKQLNQ